MDTNWCSFCDKSINIFSNSLYCSEQCMRQDALEHSPLLGYNYNEYREFFSERRRSSSAWNIKNEDNESINTTHNYSSSYQINYNIPSLSSSLSSNASSIMYNNQLHHDDRPVSQQQQQQQRKGSLVLPRRSNLFGQSL
ncbi:hypothetical protein INT45_011672 [Circinella minor]|uniref:Uncharacterized protein n=1 Tax=Circinella minor TaxID=1195481 RepID=A0A8H7RZ45_9FUNG|nr:hypothetical protein INT45_011672 [Circinella minor]